MRPRAKTQTNRAIRHRQIVRKVLLADRLAKTLERPTKKSRFTFFKGLAQKPRQLAAVSGALILMFAVGLVGIRVLSDQATAAREREVAEQQKVARTRSAEADECRRQKVAQKAHQLGKITYDQMYDGDACDKL